MVAAGIDLLDLASRYGDAAAARCRLRLASTLLGGRHSRRE
jgi:hypothetical protein